VPKAGKGWTVGTWLTHWITEIVPGSVGENTLAGYDVAVRVHLIPGLGAHRLPKLEPEHLERFYRRMQANGSAAGTAHQAHRTIRVALAEAERRGHLARNVASIAKAPKLEEEEVEPFEVGEVQTLLEAARRRRNSARWVFALALGLRQGEVLGLRWPDIDFERGVAWVRRGRLRPKYQHGCRVPCGRKPGFCPDKVAARRETKDTKSRAGRRAVPLPEPVLAILRQHKEEQDRERALARDLWVEKGYIFTTEVGEPINPSTDYHHWKRLLREAGIRDGRLHDARHTASTVLLLLGVPERIVMAIMGWSSAAMAKRYQHVTDPMLHEVGRKIGGLLWGGTVDPQ
jgi:integrase